MEAGIEMKFAIRDDDINYFTRPEELEKVYDGIWDLVPISLSVVPFIGGGETGAIPSKYWRSEKIFPLGENMQLVKFLREQLSKGRISLMLHGYSHRDYPRGYEFEAGEDLFAKVKKGKDYLEELFDVEIKTFVPPHNSLSRAGAQAVIDNGLNILIAYSHWPWERPFERANFVNFAKMLWFWLRYGKSKRYPKALCFSRHKEFGCYTLHPRVSLQELKEGLEFAIKRRGNFCLAVHYYTLVKDERLLGLLKDFVSYTKELEERQIEYVEADRLFE